MRMANSFVLDEVGLAAEQTVAREFELAQYLGETRQHLEQRQRRAIAQRTGIPHRLTQHLQTGRSAMPASPKG